MARPNALLTTSLETLEKRLNSFSEAKLYNTVSENQLITS